MERLKCMARQCFITAYQSLPDDEVSLHGIVNYKKKVFLCVVLRVVLLFKHLAKPSGTAPSIAAARGGRREVIHVLTCRHAPDRLSAAIVVAAHEEGRCRFPAVRRKPVYGAPANFCSVSIFLLGCRVFLCCQNTRSALLSYSNSRGSQVINGEPVSPPSPPFQIPPLQRSGCLRRALDCVGRCCSSVRGLGVELVVRRSCDIGSVSLLWSMTVRAYTPLGACAYYEQHELSTSRLTP